jgi:ATP-dependent RNA helicase DeaD
MKFTDTGLKPTILKSLDRMKYIDLTPVQEQTFEHIMANKDVLAEAETGSGKTSACAIPIVHNVDPDLNEVQALVLVPTRELALQYFEEIAQIAKYSEIVPFTVFGGTDMSLQVSKLSHKVHILVATPGRLIDLLHNSPLSLSHVKTFVLDEADEMLKMGFIDDVNFVMSCMIQEHQTLFFSATVPPAISNLIDRYLKDPVKISLYGRKVSPKNLKHCFNHIGPNLRVDRLEKYLSDLDIDQCIIFCNSRIGGEKLHHKIRKRHSSIEFIHGGIDQNRRTSIYNRFKKGKVKIMVATDIASRGLDFSNVTHVFNYDFPRDHEIYTHRTGRTGRAGRHGTAITFVTSRELRTVKKLIANFKIEAEWHGDVPDLNKIKHHAGQSDGKQRHFHKKSNRPSG